MRVAWLGLGIMGSRQAANLVRAGHELTVWNRTRETADAWAAEHRATVAGTPAEAVREAEVAVSVLAQAEPPEGLLCVDMSTIGAEEARSIGGWLAERGVRFMDAPVTGSSPKAEDGTLTIMAGGERSDFDAAQALFEAMGELIVH